MKHLRKLYDNQSIKDKISWLNSILGLNLTHISACSYDTNAFKGNIENPIGVAQIPIGLVGPLLVSGKYAQGNFYVPMATTEGAMVLTYDLGSRICAMSEPIQVAVVSNVIHITPIFLPRFDQREHLHKFIEENYLSIKRVAEDGSSHTTLLGIEHHIVDDCYLLKFKYDTEDAHGLNMINNATFNACQYISQSVGIEFYHRSHFSGVKHHSLLNETEGYGRNVKAGVTISKKALNMLRVTSSQIKDFFDRCIKCGTAARISNVNVHAANGIAAIFLACGQDMADLSSSHVCKSSTEIVNDGNDLYVEVILPNLLIGTVGGGTSLGTQRECLSIMGCYGAGNANKFAELIAATVLAGEITTASAVVNKSYVNVHNRFGRNKIEKKLNTRP